MKAQSHCFLWEITKILGGAYCVGNSWAGEPPYFPRRTILLRIPLATIIRVAKHPFKQTGRPVISLPLRWRWTTNFPQPDIAAELNSTGRSSDKFPQSSLDVYKRCLFLIWAIFRFPNDWHHRQQNLALLLRFFAKEVTGFAVRWMLWLGDWCHHNWISEQNKFCFCSHICGRIGSPFMKGYTIVGENCICVEAYENKLMC